MKVSAVPRVAKQGTEAFGIPGVESSIWTERMVLALVNGVEGRVAQQPFAIGRGGRQSFLYPYPCRYDGFAEASL